MGWFDVATARDGMDYSVSTFPTGLSPASWHPDNPADRIPLGMLDYLNPATLIRLVINRLVFRKGWTVVIAPWRGGWAKQWKVRVGSELESDRRAEAYFHLIQSGQWAPSEEPPPEPATTA